MFAFAFIAALLFAATDSAAITLENLENEVNQVGDWARGTAQEAKGWIKNETNVVGKWTEEKLNDAKGWEKNTTNIVVKWTEEKLHEAKGWVVNETNIVGKLTEEKLSEAKEWVKNETNIGEKWTKEVLNEIDGWAQTELLDTEEFLRALIPNLSGDDCVCYHRTCGCCIHAEEPEIHLNSTVCVNVTYLSEDYGISFTVTLNNHTLYNETVSVRNPPPVCVGFPYVKELADICVRLYDIDAKSRTLHACARLEARMKFVIIAHYDLGCFTIGSSVKDSEKQNDLETYHASVVLI